MRRKKTLGGNRTISGEAPGVPQQPKRRKLILGVLSLFFGGFMLLGLLTSTQKGPLSGEVVALTLFVLIPILNGIFMLGNYYKTRRIALEAREKALKAEKMREIVRLAEQKKGRLTLTEVIGGTFLHPTEAEKILQEMATRGYIDMQVTDSGVVVYEFIEIARKDKDSAKGILE